MDYGDAAAMLGERQRYRMRGRNTYLVRSCPRSIELKYHGTVVVKWWADGRVRLDSGGWRTATTKHRLNWSGFNVWQRRGEWFVRPLIFDGSVASVPFRDGMILGGPVR